MYYLDQVHKKNFCYLLPLATIVDQITSRLQFCFHHFKMEILLITVVFLSNNQKDAQNATSFIISTRDLELMQVPGVRTAKHKKTRKFPKIYY